MHQRAHALSPSLHRRMRTGQRADPSRRAVIVCGLSARRRRRRGIECRVPGENSPLVRGVSVWACAMYTRLRTACTAVPNTTVHAATTTTKIPSAITNSLRRSMQRVSGLRPLHAEPTIRGQFDALHDHSVVETGGSPSGDGCVGCGVVVCDPEFIG